jgi:CBS domain-containing protein
MAMIVEMILRAKGRQTETIFPEATVPMVIDRLTTQGIGALVVTSDGEHVQGVVSERDLVRGFARHGERLFGMQAAEIMSRRVPLCTSRDSVKHVMAEMTRTRQRHLPVVEDGKLVGIVSIGDVVKSRLEEIEMETAVLRDAYPFTAVLRDTYPFMAEG